MACHCGSTSVRWPVATHGQSESTGGTEKGRAHKTQSPPPHLTPTNPLPPAGLLYLLKFTRLPNSAICRQPNVQVHEPKGSGLHPNPNTCMAEVLRLQSKQWQTTLHRTPPPARKAQTWILGGNVVSWTQPNESDVRLLPSRTTRELLSEGIKHESLSQQPRRHYTEADYYLLKCQNQNQVLGWANFCLSACQDWSSPGPGQERATRKGRNPTERNYS